MEHPSRKKVKGVELHPFQMEWIDWGAVTVFIAVLLIVLFITLADPVIRLIRLELRYKGKQEEKILEAKTAALDNQKLQQAMEERADYEADRLTDQIIGAAQPQLSNYSPTTRYVQTLSTPALPGAEWRTTGDGGWNLWDRLPNEGSTRRWRYFDRLTTKEWEAIKNQHGAEVCSDDLDSRSGGDVDSMVADGGQTTDVATSGDVAVATSGKAGEDKKTPL